VLFKSKGSSRKRTIEKLKTTTRLKEKNKSWNTPQIKTIKNNHELRLTTPLIQQTDPEYTPLKYLTPSVE
jgi:hypothetical protein